jgi:hypothetical protein
LFCLFRSAGTLLFYYFIFKRTLHAALMIGRTVSVQLCNLIFEFFFKREEKKENCKIPL